MAGFSLAHRKGVRTSVKYMVIYRHRDKFSISELCRFFDVSRSGYYGYVGRMNIPAKDLPLAEKIQECQDKCGKTYGYRRVHIWLERNGIHHNPKTILRVMQKYNLLSVVRRKKFRNYAQQLHKYPNLLNRDFYADEPNKKWVTDISYIKTAQGTLYLSIIRDLYDNSIVSYKTGTEQNVNLVLSTIRAAKRKEKVTAEVQLHSDQGFQYTSQAYFRLTQSYGITPSMSRRGNPYDNALAENFFSILKTECIYRTKLKTYEEARLLIGEYIHFYNNERIQLKTKLTPLEKRSQYVA
jgi:putative transposase